MEVDANLQVLDLLFDDQEGVLSKEFDNTHVPPLDFVSILRQVMLTSLL